MKFAKNLFRLGTESAFSVLAEAKKIEATGKKIINLGKAEYIKDLDSLPSPAYHLVDFSKYSTKVTRRNSVDLPRSFPYARLYTSRGSGCRMRGKKRGVFDARYRPISPTY